ncbi:MAG TPA: 3'-5' exonuclease, partial [Symbiobacteriaceae bacterium]|nr:3'-5' exonuclease [Symbiobacteriaceae bacterium]
YKNEPRTGRGTSVRVERENRDYIWAVYEKYEELNTQKGCWDWDDISLRLLKAKSDGLIQPDRCPKYVLIDEAQDLTVTQLKAIKALTTVSLTIAADKGQSIYQRNFSWAELGIDIRGRSRSLEKTFRSTRQIIQLARSLQRHDPLVLKKSEEYVPAADPDNDGPMPSLYVARDLDSQVAQVIDWAAKIRRTPAMAEDTIGVIVPTANVRKKFEEAFKAARLPYVVLNSSKGVDVLAPGIKLVTFHSAKGLEFDHVAVTSLKDGLVPMFSSKEMTREDREEFTATERRKVYVALTRAKLTLAVFAAQPLSPFVGEMDSTLYKRG